MKPVAFANQQNFYVFTKEYSYCNNNNNNNKYLSRHAKLWSICFCKGKNKGIPTVPLVKQSDSANMI